MGPSDGFSHLWIYHGTDPRPFAPVRHNRALDPYGDYQRQGGLDASTRRVERKRKPVCCLDSRDLMPTMPMTSPSKSVSLPDELVCEDNVIPKK